MDDRQISNFLQEYARCGVIAKAARASGVSSSAVRLLRASNADFAAAFDQAGEDAVDALDSEARRRALDGVEEPVVYQGALTPVWERDANGDVVMREIEGPDDPVLGIPTRQWVSVQARNEDGSLKWLTVRKFSDALLMFQLKGLRRKLYGDKQEITGENGGPIMMDATTRAARAAALIATARTRKAQAEGSE